MTDGVCEAWVRAPHPLQEHHAQGKLHRQSGAGGWVSLPLCVEEQSPPGVMELSRCRAMGAGSREARGSTGGGTQSHAPEGPVLYPPGPRALTCIGNNFWNLESAPFHSRPRAALSFRQREGEATALELSLVLRGLPWGARASTQVAHPVSPTSGGSSILIPVFSRRGSWAG